MSNLYSEYGIEYWLEKNSLHRLDGPAITIGDDKQWWFHNIHIDCSSQEEFERLIKLRMFW